MPRQGRGRMLRSLRHTLTGGRTWLAQTLAALALLAMVVRALLPQGFMLAPAQSGDGPISVQLCSEHGVIDLLFDPTTGAFLPKDSAAGHGSKKTPQADAPCVFAAVAHLAAPVVPALPIVAPLRVAAATFATTFIAPGLGPAAPPPFSTGPPQSH